MGSQCWRSEDSLGAGLTMAGITKVTWAGVTRAAKVTCHVVNCWKWVECESIYREVFRIVAIVTLHSLARWHSMWCDTSSHTVTLHVMWHSIWHWDTPCDVTLYLTLWHSMWCDTPWDVTLHHLHVTLWHSMWCGKTRWHSMWWRNDFRPERLWNSHWISIKCGCVT